MPYICIQPGCGYEFPGRPSGKCPNCEKSPFHLEKGSTYTEAEFRGRKKFNNPINKTALKKAH